MPPIELKARGRSLDVGFPRGWLAEHPLTAADLDQEAEYLDAAGFRLRAT